MPKSPYGSNGPLKAWENICGICRRRWPKDQMVMQRGVLICTRPSCKDEDE